MIYEIDRENGKNNVTKRQSNENAKFGILLDLPDGDHVLITSNFIKEYAKILESYEIAKT